MLAIGEEKNECYKKILKYNTQLKEVSIKRPHSIKSRVNRYFVGVYNDVSSITGGNRNRCTKSKKELTLMLTIFSDEQERIRDIQQEVKRGEHAYSS